MEQIQTILSKIQLWYRSHNERERLTINIGLVTLLVFMLWQLLNSSAQYAQEQQTKAASNQSLLNWAQRQIALIQANQTSGQKAGPNGSITQAINQTAKRFQVNVERIQPQSTDNVRVGIADISYNQMLLWLAELQAEHQVLVLNLDIEAAEQPGVVRVKRLDLGR